MNQAGFIRAMLALGITAVKEKRVGLWLTSGNRICGYVKAHNTEQVTLEVWSVGCGNRAFDLGEQGRTMAVVELSAIHALVLAK